MGKLVFIGLFGYLFILVVYYLLFKYSLRSEHLGPSERTAIYLDPVNKLQFFFSQPLSSAFHFTWLLNENNFIGRQVSLLLFGVWLLLTFFQNPQLPVIKRIALVGMVVTLLVLIYFPALIVKENYASNRTLLALEVAVFILVGNMILGMIKDKKKQWVFVAITGLLLAGNSAYNYRRQFLAPIESEYLSVRTYLEKNYRPAVKTVYFIRASEDAFQQKYHVVSSWDEYGVPSTFFEWVPEYFVKQVVFEKTGSRVIAEQLSIKNWPDKASFLQSGSIINDSTLLVEADPLIAAGE